MAVQRSGGASTNSNAGAEYVVAPPAEDDDQEEARREALAWVALHARAAADAEHELAVELAKRDTKVTVIILLINNTYVPRSYDMMVCRSRISSRFDHHPRYYNKHQTTENVQ